MSDKNTAILHRIYEAFESNDAATFFGFLSPEIDIIQSPQVPWGGTFHGLEEARRFFGKLAAYLDNHVTVERMINGGDRVAIIGRILGIVRITGKSFDVPIMHLWRFEDALAIRLEIVIDVPTMQAALLDGDIGISERALPAVD